MILFFSYIVANAPEFNEELLYMTEPTVLLDKDGNEVALLDVLADDKPDMFTNIVKKTDIEDLFRYIKILNEREKDILVKRYGLYGSKEYTQKEIAKYLGISRSYVSRIEKRALTKILREFLKNNKDA